MEKLTVEQALEALLEHTKVIEETETVPLLQACGRVLAKDMIAGFDNPPFDRSPVDGYACKAEDITDASESHPVQLTVLEEIDAGQYSRVTVEKGQAVRMKEFGAELVEVAAIEDRPQAMTAAGEVMALDWGITLQCDTTGKEDASSVGVRSHFIHPVLPEADGTTKNVFPCKVERVIEDVFSYILIVSTKEEARIRVDVTKEQWQQYQKHISGNKIWIGIDEKDVMLLK